MMNQKCTSLSLQGRELVGCARAIIIRQRYCSEICRLSFPRFCEYAFWSPSLFLPQMSHCQRTNPAVAAAKEVEGMTNLSLKSEQTAIHSQSYLV
jgi:hypothetical protein